MMDSLLMMNAVNATGLAILVLDAAGQIADANPAATALLGYDYNDLLGLQVPAFLPVASLAELMRFVDATAVHLDVRNMTARSKTGRPVPLAIEITPWVDAAGRHFSTLILRDIVAERQLGRLVNNDLIRSNNAILGANIGVFEYDPIANTVIVSDIWRMLLELEPLEIVDEQAVWRSRVHPDDLAAALEPVRRCAEGRVSRANCEYRLRSRDGLRWRWMRSDIAIAQRDDTGRVSQLIGAQTDITESKKMEEALRISVEQFRSAFENAPIGLAIIGLDGSWQRVNPALCNLLGYTEDELHETNFQSLTHPDDLEADLSQLNLLMQGAIPSYKIEKRYYRSNGAIMWGMLSVGMVRNAERRPDHFISQIVDVTEQRRFNQVKTEFVSIVSHELRTPLTSILGALSLLALMDDEPFSDEVQRLLFIAKTNGDRLNQMVSDILDFEKFSTTQMRFTISRQSVVALVEEALLANLAYADKFGVRFTVKSPDRALTGLVDPKRFHQVMANLLSNAAKFADRASTVDVSVQKQGTEILVSISNTGPGIPDSFRDQVFKPFSQAAPSSNRTRGGTGLGLSIAQQIVEQMGGLIGFESVPDGRTTFWFTVPTDTPVLVQTD